MEKERSPISHFVIFFLLGTFHYSFGQTTINEIIVRNSTKLDSLQLNKQKKYNNDGAYNKDSISFYYRALNCDSISFSFDNFNQDFNIKQSKFTYFPEFFTSVKKDKIKAGAEFKISLNDCNRWFTFTLDRHNVNSISTVIIEPMVYSDNALIDTENDLNKEFASIRLTKYNYELLKLIWKGSPR